MIFGEKPTKSKKEDIKPTRGKEYKCFMCREPLEKDYPFMFCQPCLGRPKKLNMGLPNTTRENEYRGNEPFTPAQ